MPAEKSAFFLALLGAVVAFIQKTSSSWYYQPICRMEKRLLILIFFLVSGMYAYGQRQNEVQANIALGAATMHWNQEILGMGTTEIADVNSIGMRYRRTFDSHWSISSGGQYFRARVLTTPAPGPAFHGLFLIYEDRQEILSVPVMVEYTFLKFLYVSVGPQLDFQLTETRFESQNRNGIGYILGLGGRYQTNRFSFFLFPNLSRHSSISFQNQEAKARQVLSVYSLQMGIGYRY